MTVLVSEAGSSALRLLKPTHTGGGPAARKRCSSWGTPQRSRVAGNQYPVTCAHSGQSAGGGTTAALNPYRVRRTLAAQLRADAAEAHRRQADFAAGTIELPAPRQPERLLGGKVTDQIVAAAQTQPRRSEHAGKPAGWA